MQKTVILIAGPTAVGKTAVSIRLASHLGTRILSADSRQCYQEMSIGTAKPSDQEQEKVQHYFINTHSIQDSISAADYEKIGLSYLNEIFEKSPVAVVCGGTGLYIKALLEGIDEMPNVSLEIEQFIREKAENLGIEWLQQTLLEKDPTFFESAEQRNPARLVRALAFFESHQTSITNFKTGRKKNRDFKVIKIALSLPRPILYERINQRVDQMMELGLLSEVETLYPFREHKNLQTVGYSEFYAQGEFPLTASQINNAVEKVKQHTRNYAKRQLTWFKKDEEFTWFSPDEFDAMEQFVESKMKNL